jgi:hypothetical protein
MLAEDQGTPIPKGHPMYANYALPRKYRTLSLSRIPLPMGEVAVLMVVVMMVLVGG